MLSKVRGLRCQRVLSASQPYGQIAGLAHQHEVGLHLVVAGLGLLDDAATVAW